MSVSIFKDKDIYVGIDVHKKSWDIKIMTAHTSQKQLHRSTPTPEFLANYLFKTYPGANYKCVYEAGFSGYWIQEELTKLGIETIIVNPADVPTTDKEKRFKDDRIDSNKLANSLRSGQLKGIYVPGKQTQLDRSLVRQRYQYASDERRIKNRIRSHLDFYGIVLDEYYDKTYWSNNYIKQLEDFATSNEDVVLEGYLNKLRSERQYALELTRKLRHLSKTERYKEQVELLRSIPGVGLLTSMVYVTEIGDISRFKKDDHYIAYIGLVPGRHASAEKDPKGRLSKRGNKRIRTALILSAWMSIMNNPEMAGYYENYKSKGKASNVAIIKIARKLALRMKAVLRDKNKYQSRIE
ncbi:MAG: IS110 family transposase [Bacteroidia bacterium]|nr:IS110 family transposase [Bacteroidia bacterium]